MSDLSAEDREWLREHPECAVCGRVYRPTIDHIVPKSKGGSEDRVNKRTLCISCNSSKGTKDNAEWERFWAPRPDRPSIEEVLKGLMLRVQG